MNRPDATHLDRLCALADRWLRRCNGLPVDGIPTGRAGLRAVLAASEDVHLDAHGRIAWRSGDLTFTAEPQARHAPSDLEPTV